MAVKKKPDPPPSPFDDDAHPLADNYRMWGQLSLTELWLTGDASLVSYVMGRAPDQVIERNRPPLIRFRDSLFQRCISKPFLQQVGRAVLSAPYALHPRTSL